MRAVLTSCPVVAGKEKATFDDLRLFMSDSGEGTLEDVEDGRVQG